MKVRKLLAGLLSAAMVLGTMSFPAFAEEEVQTVPDETVLEVQSTNEEPTETPIETPTETPTEETEVANVAQVGEVEYSTLAEAVAAANAVGGIGPVTIKITVPGVYDPIKITRENVTVEGIVGATAEESTVIKSTADTTSIVNAQNVTFKNLYIDNSGYTANSNNFAINFMQGGNTYNFTADGCYFVGNGQGTALYYHTEKATIKNCTFENFERGYYACGDNNAMEKLTVTGNTFKNVKVPVDGYWGRVYTGSEDYNIVITDNTFDPGTWETAYIQLWDYVQYGHHLGWNNCGVGSAIKANIANNTYNGKTVFYPTHCNVYAVTKIDIADADKASLTIIPRYFVALPDEVTDADITYADGSPIDLWNTKLYRSASGKKLFYTVPEGEFKVTAKKGTLTSEATLTVTAPAEGSVLGAAPTVTLSPSAFKTAKIGDNYYDTLADAVAAAQDGDTVTILLETNSEELNIPALKNVTIEGAEGIKPILKKVISINKNSENVTFSNIEFSPTSSSYTLLIQGKNIKFIDCDFLAKRSYNTIAVTKMNNAENITFENCKFDGTTLWGNTTGSQLISSPSCKNLTIKKCSFTNAFSAFYYGCISGDWLVEDSVFDVYAYTTHTASDTVCESLTVKRTSFNGWTSYAGVKQALFEDCSFGGGTGYYYYPVLRAYSNTTLRNCTFSPDFNIEAGENTYPRWIVDNCKKDGEILRRNDQFFSEEVDIENQTAEFIFPSEAKVIDTAKTTGAEITLDNLNAHKNVDINEDATYKVVVSTAPVEDVAKANEAIANNTADTNKSKAIFDISVIKTDSYGVETDMGGNSATSIKNQQVTLTLGETPDAGSTVFIYHVDDLGNATKVAEVTADGTNKVTFTAPSFSTYAATYTAASLAETEITKNIGVKFERVGDTTSYDIVLKALDDKTINRFMSTDLTFDMNVTEGAVGYTITPAANINLVDNGNGRYEFNLDGRNSSGATGTEITIGTVTFDGYGKIDFEVTGTVDTNIVNTATAINNIVDSYTILGDGTTTGKLDLTNKLTDVEFKAPTKDLTVNVKFPNAVNNNAKAYQDMKVEISGGDLAAPITRELGSDNTDVSFTTDTYTTTVADVLTQNITYTVTVSGAGYRTARYTVTMTEDKTLNFWNNVKNTAEVVEVGSDPSKAKNVTFLAGEIVKDNNINIYDLSAVVSYFGTTNGVGAYSAYAKYDLNRDGKIDSKDVAYVLVSWGK